MKKNYEILKHSSGFLNVLLNNINSGVFVLNNNFEIQEFNDSLKTIFGISDESKIYNQRCGNVIGCVFAVDEQKQCGETTNCDNCLLRQTSMHTMNTKEELYKHELSRKFYLGGDTAHLKHLLFSTRYVSFKDQDYVVVIIDDISQLVEQKLLIEKQKKHIEDSIHYSRHIVDAMMPKADKLYSESFESFLLLREKDCIGGDFYWHRWVGESLYLAVGDCTGHGVPGALLSVLGMTLLNDICAENPNLHANEVLDMLREGVVAYLNEKESDMYDGMDIAFCVLKKELIEFAGAFNPLLRIRGGTLEVFEADRMPIGYLAGNDAPFRCHSIILQPNDSFYMFSDGFQSQFGGADNKKLNKKRFYAILQSLSTLPMREQSAALISEFDQWRGENDQIDDVSVFGMRFR